MKICHPKLLKHLRCDKSYAYAQTVSSNNNNKTTEDSLSIAFAPFDHYLKLFLNQSPQAEYASLLSGHQYKKFKFLYIYSVQSLSCVRLCDPTDCSLPGLPVHHQLPEFTQTHVHRVGDAIQPSHHLSSPSAFSCSQHQGLFK